MSRLLPIDDCLECNYCENGYCTHLEVLFNYGKKRFIGSPYKFPSWCPLEEIPENKLSVKGRPVEINGERAAIYDTVGYSKEAKDEPNT